jgi:hypothetical protein
MIASQFDRTECYAELGQVEKRLGATISHHLNARLGISDQISRSQWGYWYTARAFRSRTDNVRRALHESERIALRHLETQLAGIKLAAVWPVLGQICHDIALFLGGGAVAGGVIGGGIGLAVSGGGALPGALAGSALGAKAGSMLLSLIGLKEIATHMIASIPKVAAAYSDGFVAAWGRVPDLTTGSADTPHFGAEYRVPDTHRAARDFARGHELLVVALLTAIVAYLTRDGRLSVLLAEIRHGSRLGPKFAHWVEQNADRLSSHPLLQEGGKGSGGAAGGGEAAPASSGRAPARARGDNDMPRSPLRGPKGLIGTSEGGPGIWQHSPRRSGGESYQEQITGTQRGIEYAVTQPGGGNPVHFDGYDAQRGVLLDAKDWKNYPPDGTDFWEATILKGAKDQLRAANGTPVEWHFSSRKGFDAIATLFGSTRLKGIHLVITPTKAN